MPKDKPALKHGGYSYLATRVYRCSNTCPAWEVCPEAKEGDNCPVLANQFITRVKGMERALSNNGKYTLNEGQKMLVKDLALLEGFTFLIEMDVLRKGMFVNKGKDITVVSALSRFYLGAKNAIRRNLQTLGLPEIFDREEEEEIIDPIQRYWQQKPAGEED